MIKIYTGTDFGKYPFATDDIEKVWEEYAEAAEFGQYEDAEAVEAEAHQDFIDSFEDFDSTNEQHLRLVAEAGLLSSAPGADPA